MNHRRLHDNAIRGLTPRLAGVVRILPLLSCQRLDRASAAETRQPSAPIREILVPFEDLNVLLEQQPRRVMLTRQEYDELVKKAKQRPQVRAPLAAAIVAADYEVTVEPQRAEIAGTLVLDVFEDGLHALPLDLSGVGLSDAKLDGRAASLGRRDGGPLQVFVEGKGRHALIAVVAPVQTTAAQQVLAFRLPRPAAVRMRLVAPGDVEIRGGAAVVRRTVDADAGVTRFELLPAAGDTSLAMSLNSHLQRQQRSVVVRTVLVARNRHGRREAPRQGDGRGLARGRRAVAVRLAPGLRSDRRRRRGAQPLGSERGGRQAACSWCNSASRRPTTWCST